MRITPRQQTGPDLTLLLLASVSLFLGLAGAAATLPWYTSPLPRDSHDHGSWRMIEAFGVKVNPREAWEARPMNAGADSMDQPWRLTIHHQGVGPFQNREFVSITRALRSIQTDHQENRGWVDIGYHFVIDPAGRIWEARPLSYVGAHAGNREANEGNVGILLLGNFDEQELNFDQSAALEALITALSSKWKIGRECVLTHDEVRREVGRSGTECPGKHLRAFVETYRSQ